MTADPVLTLVVAGSRPNGPRPELFESLGSALADGTIEVVVASSDERPPPPLRPGVRWLSLPAETTIPRLRAAGLAVVRSRWAALTEDFCIPSKCWAEHMLAAVRTVAASAVGGPVDRLDGAAKDWALTFREFGPFLARRDRGVAPDLPEVNAAYRLSTLRSVLGERPDRLLVVELNRALLARGEVLWHEPGATMLDASDVPFAAALESQYHHGRLYGAWRVSGRRLPHHLIRFLAAPLVPFVSLTRISLAAWSGDRLKALARSLPPLLLLQVAWACGEAVGSVRGEGESARRWT